MNTSAILLGALVIGIVLGLIPLIFGFYRGCKAFAIGGFFACVASGFALGIILGLPICVLFVCLIQSKYKKDSLKNLKECPFCAEMISNKAKVCKYCNHEIN